MHAQSLYPLPNLLIRLSTARAKGLYHAVDDFSEFSGFSRLRLLVSRFSRKQFTTQLLNSLKQSTSHGVVIHRRLDSGSTRGFRDNQVWKLHFAPRVVPWTLGSQNCCAIYQFTKCAAQFINCANSQIAPNNAFRQAELDNGYSYRLDFFTVQRRFVPKCAFSPTAAAPVLTSWLYQKLTLFSFVLHSFLL